MGLSDRVSNVFVCRMEFGNRIASVGGSGLNEMELTRVKNLLFYFSRKYFCFLVLTTEREFVVKRIILFGFYVELR